MQYKDMYRQDKQPSNKEITENTGSETRELGQSLFQYIARTTHKYNKDSSVTITPSP